MNKMGLSKIIILMATNKNINPTIVRVATVQATVPPFLVNMKMV